MGALLCGRQEYGHVASFSGELAPNQIEVHVITLGNDGEFSHTEAVDWDGRRTNGGPRPRFFVTRSACTDFKPPPPPVTRAEVAAMSGDCAVIETTDWGWFGAFDGNARGDAYYFQVGRGDEKEFGPPFIGYWPGKTREDRVRAYPPFTYKIWAVGDSTRPTRYRLEVNWQYGPDC